MNKEKPRFTKDSIPTDFTISLVLVDAIPVLFFGASAVVISMLFHSKLFLLGSLLCLIGGACKVLWKLIVVLKQKNIWSLFLQMRILMPIGFLCIIASVFLNRSRVQLTSIWAGFTSLPSLYFFLAGIFGMCMMMVMAFKLDAGDVKANWIEQCTNGLAQIAIFIGLVLLLCK